MIKTYRTRLTNPEYNAVLKLTGNLKVDSDFDIISCGQYDDKFQDFGSGEMVSLKTGLSWLADAMVYSLQHDGMTAEEAVLITNLMVEFDVMTPESAHSYLEPDEEEE